MTGVPRLCSKAGDLSVLNRSCHSRPPHDHSRDLRELSLRKSIRFSIASLLILMVAVAIIVRWFDPSAAPERGTRRWQKHVCFDYASGVAEIGNKKNVWQNCTVIRGDGHYCIIEEGSQTLGTTDSGYFSIGIQLPKNLNVNDAIELRSIAPTSGSKHSLHVMKSGEIVAMEFGHPRSWDLESTDEIPHGKITIKQLDEEFLLVKLVACIRLEKGQLLELDNEYRLERRYPISPIDALPEKTQTTDP